MAKKNREEIRYPRFLYPGNAGPANLINLRISFVISYHLSIYQFTDTTLQCDRCLVINKPMKSSQCYVKGTSAQGCNIDNDNVQTCCCSTDNCNKDYATCKKDPTSSARYGKQYGVIVVVFAILAMSVAA